MDKSKIYVQNLTKRYRKQNEKEPRLLFENLEMEIREGKFVAILGESGCGKTTLLNLLAALDKTYTGTITVFGENISQLSDWKLAKFRRHHIGYIFQTHLLIREMTILNNVMLPLELLGRPKAEQIKLGKQILDRVGLINEINALPEEISIGQQQRAGIARALIHCPRIIFADEPTGSLDDKNASLVMKEFQELQQEFQVTIVMVTHNPKLTETLDGVFWIDKSPKRGKLQAQPFLPETGV